jgi:hypothetical protein
MSSNADVSYGDLGTGLIKTYLDELVEWGYLLLFEKVTRYKPLGPQEFLKKVLVPEVAIMLIQARQGLESKENPSLDDISYTQAQEIRRKSTLYGQVAYYPMDSEVPGDILSAFASASKSRKEEVAKMRGMAKDGSKKRAKAAIVDLTEEEMDQVDVYQKVSPLAAGPSKQTVIHINDNEYETDMQDEATPIPSQTSFRFSPRRGKSEIRYTSNSPVRPRSSMSKSMSPQKRINAQDSRLPDPSPPISTPVSSQTMSRSESATSTPRQRCRKKKKAEAGGIERDSQTRAGASLSKSMSQDSFGNFDFTSQDLADVDAVVAAQ